MSIMKDGLRCGAAIAQDRIRFHGETNPGDEELAAVAARIWHVNPKSESPDVAAEWARQFAIGFRSVAGE